ncbi:hypothetical protein K435DRAFT_456998 [Dendrothele bispora CBS 962.96]|uniref:Uncharacterized protein n=1 Tax=Dendrothele bispora (strain CBS 962.96) TaxID=1314807 RepID=A0A4S8L1P6_DENBC|nr:hypothetical protein K435DRAFT_456998 [Dendrothele bispora CBS 962.96]
MDITCRHTLRFPDFARRERKEGAGGAGGKGRRRTKAHRRKSRKKKSVGYDEESSSGEMWVEDKGGEDEGRREVDSRSFNYPTNTNDELVPVPLSTSTSNPRSPNTFKIPLNPVLVKTVSVLFKFQRRLGSFGSYCSVVSPRQPQHHHCHCHHHLHHHFAVKELTEPECQFDSLTGNSKSFAWCFYYYCAYSAYASILLTAVVGVPLSPPSPFLRIFFDPCSGGCHHHHQHQHQHRSCHCYCLCRLHASRSSSSTLTSILLSLSLSTFQPFACCTLSLPLLILLTVSISDGSLRAHVKRLLNLLESESESESECLSSSPSSSSSSSVSTASRKRKRREDSETSDVSRFIRKRKSGYRFAGTSKQHDAYACAYDNDNNDFKVSWVDKYQADYENHAPRPRRGHGHRHGYGREHEHEHDYDDPDRHKDKDKKGYYCHHLCYYNRYYENFGSQNDYLSLFRLYLYLYHHSHYYYRLHHPNQLQLHHLYYRCDCCCCCDYQRCRRQYRHRHHWNGGFHIHLCRYCCQGRRGFRSGGSSLCGDSKVHDNNSCRTFFSTSSTSTTTSKSTLSSSSGSSSCPSSGPSTSFSRLIRSILSTSLNPSISVLLLSRLRRQQHRPILTFISLVFGVSSVSGASVTSFATSSSSSSLLSSSFSSSPSPSSSSVSSSSDSAEHSNDDHDHDYDHDNGYHSSSHSHSHPNRRSRFGSRFGSGWKRVGRSGHHHLHLHHHRLRQQDYLQSLANGKTDIDGNRRKGYSEMMSGDVKDLDNDDLSTQGTNTGTGTETGSGSGRGEGRSWDGEEGLLDVLGTDVDDEKESTPSPSCCCCTRSLPPYLPTPLPPLPTSYSGSASEGPSSSPPLAATKALAAVLPPPPIISLDPHSDANPDLGSVENLYRRRRDSITSRTFVQESSPSACICGGGESSGGSGSGTGRSGPTSTHTAGIEINNNPKSPSSDSPPRGPGFSDSESETELGLGDGDAIRSASGSGSRSNGQSLMGANEFKGEGFGGDVDVGLDDGFRGSCRRRTGKEARGEGKMGPCQVETEMVVFDEVGEIEVVAEAGRRCGWALDIEELTTEGEKEDFRKIHLPLDLSGPNSSGVYRLQCQSGLTTYCNEEIWTPSPDERDRRGSDDFHLTLHRTLDVGCVQDGYHREEHEFEEALQLPLVNVVNVNDNVPGNVFGGCSGFSKSQKVRESSSQKGVVQDVANPVTPGRLLGKRQHRTGVEEGSERFDRRQDSSASSSTSSMSTTDADPASTSVSSVQGAGSVVDS